MVAGGLRGRGRRRMMKGFADQPQPPGCYRPMQPQNALLSATGTTIFTVMSALATEHGAINLGQGFPDYDGPEDVIEAAAAALKDGRNQYPPLTGVPELRQAVAAHNKR